MNKKIVSYLILTLILGVFTINVQAADKKNPEGKWKFSVQDAPYGYEKGELEISKKKKEYAGTMMFDGFEYKLECENVRFEKEELSFTLFVEGEDVLLVLKFSEKDKLSGRAVYSMGELSISAERVK